MLTVRNILGAVHEPRYSRRRVEWFVVAWSEATRRRLRRTTDTGTDVATDLPAKSYLFHGAVLDDDGERVVAVERPAERALCIRFDATLTSENLVASAACIAHVFGNQHVPIDVVDTELRVPITTSEAVAEQTVRELGIDGVHLTLAEVRLGTDHALPTAHPHRRT